MKFGVAKLFKAFCKNTEKKFKRKKKNNKELRLFENRNVNTYSCYGGRKSFFTWQIQRRCYGVPDGTLPSILVY